MSTSRSRGHGLEESDVDRIFPDPVIDYKRRAAGERDDEPGPAGNEAAQPQSKKGLEGNLFEEEPWPDPPIEEESPEPEEDVDLHQEPAKSAGQLMIDFMITPEAPVRAEHKKLEPLPSDKTWRDEMKKLLRGQP